jgi:serine/threonine protein kinase
LHDRREILKAASERVGTVVAGRYHIEAVLDADVFAASYVAADSLTNSVHEFDVLSAEAADDPDVLSEFAGAARTASVIDSLGVLHLVDEGVTEEGLPFITFGPIERGETAATYLRRRGKTIPPAEALRIVSEALEVLDAAHKAGSVHGGLSPRSLLMHDSGAVSVRGIGLSELRGAFAARAGVAFHSPLIAFMPPELLQNMAPDPHTDMWSAMAVLFALLTGQFVYAGLTEEDIYNNAMLGKRRALYQAERKAPSVLVEVFERAMADDPIDRYASAQDLAAILRELSDDTVIRRLRYLTDTPTPERPSRAPRPAGPEPLSPAPASPVSAPGSGAGSARLSGAYSQVEPTMSQVEVARPARLSTPGRPAVPGVRTSGKPDPEKR